MNISRWGIMIKMEKTCGSPKGEVMRKGKRIGHMDGLNVTQWFLKNKYKYTGTFSRFITEDPDESQSGIKIDIIMPEKHLIIKDACIEWMKSPLNNGTFNAKSIESYEEPI
jgi:hypothetical protein